MKKLYLLLLLCIAGMAGYAQTTYYYRGGTFTTVTNWNSARDGSGTTPIDFTGATDTWVVTTANALTVNAAWTVAGAVEVEGSCTINTNPTVNGAILVKNGGTLTQAVANTSTVPNMATVQEVGSTIVYSGAAGTRSIPGITFGNLRISSTVTTTAAADITVDGTFTVDVGCTMTMATFRLIAGTGFSAAVSGALSTTNISSEPIPSAQTWGGTVTYGSTTSQSVVAGDYNNLTIGASGTVTHTAQGAISVANTLNLAASGVTFADNGNTITVGGNITGAGKHSGAGKILMTGASRTIAASSGIGNIEFDNAAGFSLAGAAFFNGTTTFTNGKVSIGAFTLTLAPGCTLVGANATNCFVGGATSSISVTATSAVGDLYLDMTTPGTTNLLANLTMNGTSGSVTLGNNITVATLLTLTAGTLNDGGNTILLTGNLTGSAGNHTGTGKILMQGSGVQTIANTGTGNQGNIELDNAAGFTLSNNTTLRSSITFTNGKLSLLARTLTLATGVTLTGHSASNCFVGSASSSTLVINSTGSVGTIFFDQTTPGTTDNVGTFTLTAGTVTLGSGITVSTLLTLTAGTLDNGGNTILLKGNLSGSAGNHTGSGKILMQGSGVQTLANTSTGNQGNVELDNAAGFTLSGNLTIRSNFTFTNGKVSLLTRTLTLATGVSLSGHSAANCFVGSASASTVVVNSTGSVGTIYFDQTTPGVTDNIGTFTLTAGTVVLGSNISITTLLTLAAGTFDDNGNVVTLAGNVSGTSATHIGSGKILMTGSTKTLSLAAGGLNNVELDNAGGFSLGGNTIVNGTLTFTNGKLSLGTRTLTLKGTVAGMSAANSITGGASSNLTINTAGTLGTLFFDQTTPGTSNNIATFTHTAGTTTLGNDLRIGTTFALTAGTLDDNGNTITYVGIAISGSGTHTSGTGGKLSLTTAPSRSISGVTLGNVELNYAGTATLTGNATISGTLTFMSTALFTISTGFRLTVNGAISGMSTSNYFSGSTTSDLTLGGSGAIGTIYFGQTTTLNNIRNFIMNGGGTVTLGSNMTSITSMDLSQSSGGKIEIGANTLALNGTFAGIASTGCLVGGPSATLSINTSSSSTLHIDQTTPGVSNNLLTLTKAGTGTITLGTGSAINTGTLALSAGTLADGGNTITVSGNITGTGTHSGAGKILMTGVGATISAATLGNLELDAAGAFSLTGSAIVNGALTFTQGTLSLNSFTLSTNGDLVGVSPTSYFTGTAGASGLTIGGSGSLSTLYFDQSVDGTSNRLATLTVNRAGAVATLGSKVLVATTLALTNGQLSINDQTLALGGTVTGSSSTNSLIGSASSNLTITGSGAVGTVFFDQTTDGTSNHIATFSLTRNTLAAGTYTMGNKMVVGTAMALTTSRVMMNGQTLELNGTFSGTSGSAALSGTTASNLVINGSGAFGTLIMDQTTAGTTNAVNNFTLDRSGQTVTLGTALVCASAFTLTNGQVSIGSNTLTLNGTFSGSASNNLIGSATSNLTIGATGSVGTLYFDQTTPGTSNNIATFTTSGAGGTTVLGNAPRISTALALSSASHTLNGNGFVISNNGNISGTGTYTSGSGGKIVMTGLSKTISGATLENIELNYASGANSFSLSGSPTITGALVFAGATNRLTLGANTLTLNGTVSGMTSNEYFTGGTTSNLVIGSSGSVGTIFMNTSSTTNRTLANVTINSGSSLTMGSIATISTALNLNGTLNDNGNVITVSGNITGTGTHTSSTGGRITMTGAAKNISGATFGNMTINNASGFILTGSPTINGDMTFSAGTVDLGSNTLTLAGTVTSMTAARYFTGGASANLVVSATGSLGTLFFNPTTPGTSNNLSSFTISGGGTATLGNALSISNTLALTSGTLAAAAQNISLAGNITGTGTHTSTTGEITMTGAGATISGATLGRLVLNNAAGFSLTGSPTITTALTLTDGRLTLGSNNLTLGSAAVAVAGTPSSANMIVADGAGQLRKLYTANGSYTFPIGDNSGDYTPITLNFTGGTYGGSAYAGVTVTDAKHPANANTDNYLSRYWSIATSNITSPAYAATATYVPADVVGTEGSISAAKYTGSLPWTKYSTVAANTLSTTAINNTSADISGVTSSSPSVSASPDVTICSGGSTNLSAVSPSGDPVLTYSWSPAAGLSATTGATVTASPTVTTTYTLTMTDGGGETATAQTVVTVTGAPTAAPANDGHICVGGTVNLTANPGGTTSTYLWAGADLAATTIADPTATPAATSVYTLTVTDGTANAGCSVSYTTTVTVNPVPTAAPTNNGYICNGGTVTLTANPANGAAAYTWTGSNLVSTTAENPGATPTATTVYSLTVSDGTAKSGCSPATVYTTSVTVNATPVATPVNSGEICVTGTVTLTATPAGGANTFTWAGANLSSTTAENPTATPTATTVYTLTVSDGSSQPGCAPATQYTTAVTVKAAPALTSASNSGLSCTGNTLDLFANGPTDVIDYSWVGPNSFTSTEQNPSIPSVTTAATGTYTVTVSNGIESGCSASYTTITTVNPTPGAITGTMSTCAGNATTLTNASGGGTWTSANNAIATVGSATGIVTGVTEGVVTITYRRPSTGCYVTTSVTVNPSPAAITGASSLCYLATTTLANATSGGAWSTSNSTVAPIDVSGVVTGGNPGVATITYTMGSGGGCRATKTITVNSLPAVIGGTAAVCSGLTTTLNAGTTTGGTWASSNTAVATIGTSNGVVSGVAAGNATVTYTWTNGCVRTTTVTVNGSPAAITGNTPVCVGSSATLANADAGGSWSKSNTAVNIGSATGIVTGVSAATAFVTYTLPNGCKTTATFTVNPVPAVIGGAATLCANGTAFLTNSVGGGAWSSSNTAVATVGTSGIVSGVSGGNVVITYTLPAGCYQTKAMTVNPISAISGSSTVCVGTSTTLTNATPGGTWSSSVAARGVIGSATGIFTATGSGTTAISYTMPTGCKSGMILTVNPNTAITGTAMACEGLTTTLANATAGGTWSSSDDAIATVGSSNGVVTGVLNGLATVTYTTSLGCFNTKEVTINSSPAAISGSSSVCAGATLTLTNAVSGGVWSSSNTAIATIGGATGIVTGVAGGNATITYSNGPNCSVTHALTVNPILPITGTTSACVGMNTTLACASAGGTWASSNTSVATVGFTGVVSGVAQGTANITYTLPSGCFRTAVVSVNPVPTSITGSGSICASLTVTLTGDDPGGVWSTSNAAIATVGSSTGVVTGVAGGTANITYTMGLNCRVTKQVTVTSSPAITGTARACIGTTTTLAHSVSGGTWASANTSVATIHSTDGIVTGVASGTTTITYTPPSGCLRTVTVTINGLPSANAGTHTVCLGSTTTVTNATAGGVSWASSNPAVASVGATSGVVTGVAVGTATLTYTVNTGCYSTSVVTVNPLPDAIVGGPSFCMGTTTTLTSGSSGGTWTSSNVGSASIGSSTGILTATAAGTPRITYTLPTGCRTSINATVNANAALTGTASVCVGASATLASATAGGAWTSANTAIATVGAATGVVTGVAAGTTDITYTTAAGCTRIAVATVNTTPGAITGTLTVCAGSTTTLGNATPSGTWNWSNVSALSVSSSGVVTAVTAGTSTISYNLGSCRATAVLTINALPAVITGTNNACVGATSTLASATAGGAWSSSNSGIASVGTAGDVTAVSAGAATITYTSAEGCIRTSAFNANPIPAAVSGTLQACPGTTTVVSSATGGGVSWSSSNTAVATVGSTSGIVTGVAAGTATMTYTVNTGCTVTGVVTINPNPAAIGGPTHVCPGSTVTLTNADAGGTWSSIHFTIDATSGAVLGTGTGGVAQVTYTLPTGCRTTRAMNVYTTAAITGPEMVCVGVGGTRSIALTGGAWSSSNTGVASINAGTGAVTAVAPGTATISYTTTDGCVVTTEQTVNGTPSGGTISGPTAVVVGLEITLSSDVVGGTWSSDDDAIATVYEDGGQVTGVTPGNVAISYTVDNGCGTATSTYTVSVVAGKLANAVTTGTEVEFSMFPNPNKGDFTIVGSFAGKGEQAIDLEVTNALGQVVHRQTLQTVDGKVNHKVKADSNLPAGLYTLKVQLPGQAKVFHYIVN